MNALASRKDYTSVPRLTFEEARTAASNLVAMRGKGAPVDNSLLGRIEQFYFMEARLLDEERYEEWYNLLADDLFYWAPLRVNQFRRDKRPEFDSGAMALFDDCKADIAVRIGRLASNLVWTEDPPTRHVYLVSGVEAFAAPGASEYETHSTFTQYRNRGEHDEATLHGRRRDLLRSVGQSFQLVQRMILLPQAVLLTKNLSAFF